MNDMQLAAFMFQLSGITFAAMQQYLLPVGLD
jgi:hypothetical protein